MTRRLLNLLTAVSLAILLALSVAWFAFRHRFAGVGPSRLLPAHTRVFFYRSAVEILYRPFEDDTATWRRNRVQEINRFDVGYLLLQEHRLIDLPGTPLTQGSTVVRAPRLCRLRLRPDRQR
jgi:hypothetical protein